MKIFFSKKLSRPLVGYNKLQFWILKFFFCLCVFEFSIKKPNTHTKKRERGKKTKRL